MDELVVRYFLLRGDDISPVNELSVENLPYYELRRVPETGDEKDIEDFILKSNRYSNQNLVFVRVTFVADIGNKQRTGYYRFCLVRE